MSSTINKNADWRKIVERVMLDEKGSWSDAVNAIAPYFPELTHEKLRRKARTVIANSVRAKDFKYEPRKKKKEPVEDDVLKKNRVTYKDNGEMIFEGIIELLSGQPITPEIVMEAHNLKPDEWKVVSFTSNAWQSQIKGGDKIVLWQSKITVRPRTETEITFADIDNYFANKDLTAPVVALNSDYDPEGEVLEICIPDLHAGLLSWRFETGEDYDLNITKTRFFKAISDIVARCKNHSFSKIEFVTLGDLLHTDNDNQTTTKGTFQQVEGRLAKIFDFTLDMMIAATQLLSEVAPVEVVYICGNHDRVLGYTLIKATEKAFTGNERVTFDVTPNPQKFRLFGNALVGWTHGDMPKKNMQGWLQDRARKEFGQCQYAEIHAGHYHSEEVHEAAGVKIRYMPNLAAASYWEHQQGFPQTTKSVVCYRWHPEKGLRSIWYNNI